MKKKVKQIVSLCMIVLLLCTSFDLSVFAKDESSEAQSGNTERGMDFNEGWSFQLGDVSGAEKMDFDDGAWRRLTLPHDWSIEQDFTHSVSSEIGHLPGGTGWYRKAFTLPKEYKDKRVSIDFGGVYMDSYIYLNGQLVGNYPYGYLPFSFDLTDYLICDGKTNNILAVKATNITDPGQHTGRWYAGSGIYRDVKLSVTEPVHVAQYGTVVTTPDIEKEYESGQVTVKMKTDVRNQGKEWVNAKVRYTILNYADKSVFSQSVESGSSQVASGGKQDFESEMEVKDPQLWSTDNPVLYIMRTEVLVDDQVVDCYDARFGFRWFTFDNNEGFSLNGQYMKLQGVCMHHDQGALGSVANEAATARQMKIMKEMGANAIRVSHNPASDVLLKQCDEQGLMVIDEAFDTWDRGKTNNDYHRFFFQPCTHPEAGEGVPWAQYDLQQMIRRGINFPSIIMWSMGNEVYESRYDHSIETAKKLVKWAKDVDTTRPTTMGEDKLRDYSAADSVGQPYVKIAQEVDVVGINYGEKNYDGYHEMYPDWIIYGSENSSALKSRGYYSEPNRTTDAGDVVQYQVSSFDNRAVPWGSTATNSLIPDRDRKWIGGQFVWTGFDYIGEPTPYAFNQESIPKSSYFGIVDTAGFAKDDYYLYQSQWLDAETDPMVHIFPHWNWENESLKNKVLIDGKIPVRVYSNAASVELFLNDESLGEKSFAQKTTEDGRTYQQQSDESDRLYLEWLLEYEYIPGTRITAKAKDREGNLIATDLITTAGEAANLKASADRSVITADGQDLCYITVDVTDASGNFMPTAMNQLNFNITGNGKIVGVDNGDGSSWERYKDYNGIWKRKAFNGKALVIVQSTKEEGSFTLTANGVGLNRDSVTVYTKTEQTDPDRILGYETPNIVTEVGKVPELPDTIKGVLADESNTEVHVVWDKITPEDVSAPKIITVQGQTETGEKVKLHLTVRGLIGILDVTLAIAKDTLPELPDMVTAVWSDGVTESRNVSWETLDPGAFGELGIVNAVGEVDGTDLPAHAVIRVAAEDDDVNIALAAQGTTVTATYEEGPGKHPVAEINDGDTSDSNGWGNWQINNRTSDAVTFEFAKEYDINRITAWLTSMNTWQIPDQILVKYWNGTEYVNVPGQSKTTGFGGRGAGYTGEDITFDSVKTNKLRLEFSVNGYNAGKDMMKITEVEVWGKGISKGKSARLSSLKVDGKELEGFDPENYSYSLEVPYGGQVPKVTAQAADHASLFVWQALENNGAAQIKVFSEDGRNTAYYTVEFTEKAPALENVEISAETTQVTEDDTVPLTVTGVLQDGRVLSEEEATVTYSVEPGSGYALIQGSSLLAYDAGTVEVTAHMTYLDQTVDSEALTFTIAKNTAVKKIVSFEEVTVYTKKGIAPALPETIRAYYDTGHPRDLDVIWDRIHAEQLEQFGEIVIEGDVNGSAIRPKLKVVVRDLTALEAVSIATPRNMVPELPETLSAYYSDGTELKNIPVQWENVSEADFNKEKDTVVYVKGTVRADDTSLTATASVRISDSYQSPSYVISRNGYVLPIGIASYTNDNAISDTGYDRANYLNDSIKSFEMVPSKKIWSNWVGGAAQRSGDWVSAVIAYEGIRVLRYVDKISVGFCQEGANQMIRTPAEYYVEYYTGPIDYEIQDTNGQVESWQNSPLNDPANWKEVDYSNKPSPSSLSSTSMTDITFKPVKTNLVRVRMDAQAGKCLGVNELEVYGQEASAHSDFSVREIRIGNEEVLDKFDQDLKMTYHHSENQLPDITVDVDQNAAVTILPAANPGGQAKIMILPENGSQLDKKTYTIQFVQDGENRPDTSTLEKLISQAENMIADGTMESATEESVQRVNSALKSAKELMGKINTGTITQSEVDAAANVLKKAMDSIQKKPDVENPAVKVTSIQISKTSVKLNKNDTLRLTVTVLPANAANPSVTWSSSNTRIATVDQNGNVTAKGIGDTIITAAAKDGSKVTGTCKITVTYPYAKSIKVKAQGLASNQKTTKIYMQKGKRLTVKGMVSPADANPKVTYQSNKKSVAAVSKSGVIKANRPGTAKITITSADKKAKKAITIQVVKKVPAVKSFKVTSGKKLNLRRGKTALIKTKVSPLRTAGRVTYKSSKKSVAAVDNYGQVTAKKKGTATITVKCMNKKAVKIKIVVK